MPVNSKEDIWKAVLEGIRELVERAGGNLDRIDPAATFEELGLDSAHGLELALMLEDALPITIPPENNPFWDDQAKHPRTLQQVVDYIGSLIESEREQDD